MSIGIDIVKNEITPGMKAKAVKLSPQRFAAAVGPAVMNLLKNHFLSLGSNKKGWPTTNFWSQAMKGTSWAQVPEGAKISVNKIGVRQRFYGGPIKPVNAKALAIPIDAESYGKLPSEFDDIVLIKTIKGAYLVRKEGGLKGSVKFLYKLSFGVEQKPDPNVLPTREEIASTAKEAFLEALKN